MSNFSNIFNSFFSNENFKNLLPSYSRNINVIYQTKQILNKISWNNDFQTVI